MKSCKQILATAIAMLLVVSVCLFSAGCDVEDIAGMAEMMDQFSDFTGNGGYTGDPVSDEDIYTLDIFDGLPTTQSDIDPLFWVAEGANGGKVYFLGSIHCADRDTYRLPDLLMDAYLESDALAVECDILAYESDYLAQIQMSQQMMYTDGSTIRDHIDPELYDAMVEFYENNPSETLTELGYTVDILDLCKPAMWMSVLEMIVYEAAGIDSNLGIDYHFLNIATAQHKEIIEIESIEFQNDMLFGFSDELMEMQLWSYVSYSVEEQGDSLREMFEGWCEGDGSYLVNTPITAEDFAGYTEKEAREYIDLLNDYYKDMLLDRNIGMADAAQDMLDNGDNVFYVVGAAHMVGNEGIIAILKDRGYTVTQLGGMNADIYTDANGDYPVLYDVDFDAIPNATTTTTTTAQETTATTSATTEEFDYDLYVQMYEYFGGTTRPQTTTTTAAATTTTTTASSDNEKDDDGNYGGSGVFGILG